MNELRLEVTEFTDVDRWRWRLTDAHGVFKADHQVALNRADPNYEAFADPYFYINYHAAPDRRLEHEAEIIDRLGHWIGEQVLGPLGARIVEFAPVTVRVLLSDRSVGLMYRPLELGHANGRPLAMQEVSFVFETAQPTSSSQKIGVREKLRMLATFSLPTDTSALGLRRERYALKRLITTIAETQGKAIELRILQYGVTRDMLREVLEEGEGWDVMHFSGHGLPAGLLLEKRDSTRDPISSRELEVLLRPARPRLKLITLSACESAAPTLRETLRWLKLYEPQREEAISTGVESLTGETSTAPAEPLPALARTLAATLDCAVLAMRYPVKDDFAIDFAAHLYRGLLGQRRSLPAAVQLALPKALSEIPRPGVPPLSMATPALFGTRAADLMLTVPQQPQTGFAVQPTGFAFFPPEPERFVGRVGAMARASAAIAPESGKTGVIFHGMPGAGKTACALELAYRYETGRFAALVWYKAPDAGSEIADALLRLALDMEKQLPEFQMAHLVDRADEFAAWLPRLTELLERRSILIVLDNIESLLWPDGQWRDDRWGLLAQALLAHQGLSRTILTSRYCPAVLGDTSSVQIEPIHALSRDEAVLLSRELPNLGNMLRGESAAGLERGRELVARTLAVVQGHPKLIELAEGQAGNPEGLARQLERATAEWAGGEGALATFFREGTSPFTPEDFLKALAEWTHAVSGALPTAARTLFHVLCALEEEDRLRGLVEANWADLWRQLEQLGEASDLAETLSYLTAAGLVEARPLQKNEVQYVVHPSVAEAGRNESGDAIQSVVDNELAVFWMEVFEHGMREEPRGRGSLVVRAGRSATPYLLRLQWWEIASPFLEHVIYRDSSRETIAAVLLQLRRIAGATEGTEVGLEVDGVLARALWFGGRSPEAEALLRMLVRQCAERGAFGPASAAMGDLLNLLKDTGRAQEALALTEEQKDHIRSAGFGPWTQLGSEAQRLQLLNTLGHYPMVLAAVEELFECMRALPETSEHEEIATPWNVREGILDVGRSAALGLGRREIALAFNAQIVASQMARGAPMLELARRNLNDYDPLLGLGCYGKVGILLDACRAVFQEEGTVSDLARVFSAQADLEDALRHHPQATAFRKTALRYSYLAGDADLCASSHFYLSNYLVREGGTPKAALAHRLAAGVIRFQTGSEQWLPTCSALGRHLASFAPDPPPLPESFDELCHIVKEVEEVPFRDLCERLPHRAATIEEALSAVLREAMDEAHRIAQE